MTTQRTFKQRVRARMAKTGERYTAARRQLLRSPEPPPDGSTGPAPSGGASAEAGAAAAPGVPAEFEPVVSDDAVLEATGHGWAHWLGVLDAWGAAERTHAETARHLVEAYGVPGWWAQSITVTFERARGLRAVGQRRGGGFDANASKTVHVPVEVLYEAVVDAEARARWLPDLLLTPRTAKPHRTARFDVEDGATRAIFGFESKGPTKSVVSVQHERIPDKAGADARKAQWREALAALRSTLEDGA